jgi:hypothetical protein
LPEGWPLGNAARYRAAFLRVTVKADPDNPRSRREIADLTGLGHSAVGEVVKRAALKAHQQAPVRLPIKHVSELTSQVKQYGRTHKARALKITSQHKDGRTVEWLYQRESAPGIVAGELAAGARVHVEFSLPNIYEVLGEVPPSVGKKSSNEVNPVGSKTTQAGSVKPGRYYGPGYDPRWLLKQTQLALKLLGWLCSGGKFVNPETGEFAPDEALGIIELLIGRSLEKEPVESADPPEAATPRTQKPPGDGWQEVPLWKPAGYSSQVNEGWAM